MTFDPKWPHGHTFMGRPVRILCTDFGHFKYPIIAAVRDDYDRPWETLFYFTKDGFQPSNDVYLTNAPAPKKVWKGWYNIYPGKITCGPYETKERANRFAGQDRTACLHIEREYEDGEGL